MPELRLMKEPAKTGPGMGEALSNNLFLIIAVLIFLTVGSLWFGLTLWQETLLQDIAVQDEEIKKIESDIKISGDARRRLANVNARLVSLEQLIEKHPYPSNVFILLEKEITHPQVHYSQMNLDIGGLTMSLSGRAASYQILAQQLSVFERHALVDYTNLSSIGLSPDGGVTFSYKLTLDPKLFKEEF